MSISVVFDGQTYSVPERREVGWSDLTDYLVALQNAAVAGGKFKANIRVSNTSPILFLSTDFTVVADMTVPAAVAVTFPAGVNETLYMVVDGTGDAATNNITITPNGSETIGGAATFVINENNQAVMFQYSSSLSDWIVVGVWKKNILTRTSVDQGAGRVLNKDFDDATTFIVDSGDTTKKLTYSLGTQTTGTVTTLQTTSTASRTLALPDISDTIVAATSNDTGTNRLKNKDLDDETINIVDSSDITKKINFEPGGQTTGTVTTVATSSTTSKTLTLPDITDTLVTRTSSDLTTNRLQNKDLSDNNVQFVDEGDTSKAFGVSLGGATASTKTTFDFVQSSNRTITFPDSTGQVLTRESADQGVNAVANKDFQATTFQVVDTSDTTKAIKFSAAANGTGRVLTLAGAATASDKTITFPNLTDTVLTNTSTSAVTNKDYDGGTASNALRLTLPKNTTANLAALTRKQGTLLYDSSLDVVKYDNGSTLSTLSTTSTATSTSAGITTSFFPLVVSSVTAISSANYVVLDNDGFRAAIFTTANSNRTLTLPTLADNQGRLITVTKIDTGTGRVTFVPEGAEVIIGISSLVLFLQGESATLLGTATGWVLVDFVWGSGAWTPTLAATSNTNVVGTTQRACVFARTAWNVVSGSGALGIDPSGGTATATTCSISLPIASAFTTNYQASGVSNGQDSAAIYQPGIIDSDATNDNMVLKYNASATQDREHRFTFSYILVP